ncbi:hypothetical protein IFM89_034608 [Coptis chinensis]|uniref:Uncharacterized protein n=1 Tax=Coptis chinensis TaxID=261450 RepID=A0A835HLY2_9MAGN|nr:hypothetical protein IFM89_034608 [Coptis chinensis]
MTGSTSHASAQLEDSPNTACQISMAGIKVCLMEKGCKWEARDFSTNSIKILFAVKIDSQKWGFNFGPKDALIQLDATSVEDQNKKCMFYGSTLQKSICDNSFCSTVSFVVGRSYSLSYRVDRRIYSRSEFVDNPFATSQKPTDFRQLIATAKAHYQRFLVMAKS